jgi:hypothetical protein
MFQLRPETRRGSSASSATSGIPAVTRRSHRGQSLVEFALVLPMLLVLLLGIADFGRVFAAGITLEAAARDGAEAAAQEYVQLVRNKAGGVLDTTDFGHLHEIAADAVCHEAKALPNQTEASGVCSMPITAVCVHDGNDPACGSEATAAPADCPKVIGAWNPANSGAAPLGSTPLPYVEVRVCYRFTTLVDLSNLQLPFGWGLSLGDIWLERDRAFTVANY